MFCDTGGTVAHLNFRHDATIHATFFGPDTSMQALNMTHENEVIQRIAVQNSDRYLWQRRVQ